jgi:predicted ATPase/DNA-binding SARP family transcriptional activator
MSRVTPSAQPVLSTLEIRLFGQASARLGDVPLKFAKRTTTFAMLALLILQRDRAMPRESLAFTLFPDHDEPGALAELRRCIYLTSKALPERAGDPWLIADAETIRWNDAAGAFVDVIAFERLATDAETADAAIDLYAGDLLESVYDDWVVAERERLRTRYLGLLDASLARHRARRDFPAAIACAKRTLATDPWREDTLRALVAVRYQSGDTAGALAEFEGFARRLRDELNAAPMAETLAVRASILRNERVPGSLDGPAGSATPERAAAIAPLPFVGRSAELASLRAAWGRAARGNGSLVLLTGEAGVGKTRLAAELASVAVAEGGRVFVGTTAAAESMPYQALVEALRSALPLVLARPPAPARRATLARLLPELGATDAAGLPLPELSPERETARIYDALAHAVRGLASPRPLLLVLEDLQWAGSPTLEALAAVVRDAVHAPLLVVATAREEELHADHPLRALVRSLRAFRHVEELGLQRLGAEDVAELVGRVDGLRERSATLARDLYAHSEGNALFLNEAINSVIERRAPIESRSTGSIAQVIAARLGSLSDEARSVAEIAAVAGAGCSVALIRDVGNATPSDVARGFDELLDRRILREASARTGHDYVFTHHLIARAVYDGIVPAFRSQRHLRIARLLEAEHRHTQASPAREIARHYECAGDATRSTDWYLRSARQAAEVFAYGDAIELAGRALANAAADSDKIAALDIRERALGRRGERAQQRADIDALARLAGGDPGRRLDVLNRRVLLARMLGESEDEGRLIDELEALAQSLDEAARAQAYTQRATHLGLRSLQAEALVPARAALAIYERLGDLHGQLECLCLLVGFTTNVGDVAASREYLALMGERAASRADRAIEAKALATAAMAVLLRGQYGECLELSRRALALQLVTGDREGEAYSRGRIASSAVRLSDFATALREYELTLETYESIGHKRGVAITYTNRAGLLMRLGLFAEALDSIERSNALLETVQEQRMVACNHVNASFIHIQLGDARAAKTHAQLALELTRQIQFPVFEAAALANLGNAERVLGNFDAAIEHMTAGIDIRRPIQDVGEFVDDLADLTLAYAESGRAREAAASAEELDALSDSNFGGAFWSHYIWWAIGHGFRSTADGDRAQAAFRRAAEEVARFAESIEDAELRAAFLAIPVNARISSASELDTRATLRRR